MVKNNEEGLKFFVQSRNDVIDTIVGAYASFSGIAPGSDFYKSLVEFGVESSKGVHDEELINYLHGVEFLGKLKDLINGNSGE